MAHTFQPLTVLDFHLRRVWSNFTLALTFDRPNCKPEGGGEFFGKAIAGGATSLTLRYSESHGECFAGRPFITGLTAVKKGFGAMRVSEGNWLTEAFGILFFGKGMRAPRITVSHGSALVPRFRLVFAGLRWQKQLSKRSMYRLLDIWIPGHKNCIFGK